MAAHSSILPCPLLYSSLGNPMDRGAWRATVHGVAKMSDVTEQLNNKLEPRGLDLLPATLLPSYPHPKPLLPKCGPFWAVSCHLLEVLRSSSPPINL